MCDPVQRQKHVRQLRSFVVTCAERDRDKERERERERERET